jgi:hypothetical protein
MGNIYPILGTIKAARSSGKKSLPAGRAACRPSPMSNGRYAAIPSPNCCAGSADEPSMIRKSGYRFSDKIMRQQKVSFVHRARRRAFSRTEQTNKANPQNYPQPRIMTPNSQFRLQPRRAALSSISDRSCLVLPNMMIAKVGLAWMRPQLPALHHVAGSILVRAAGSSARNVTGGRKLARHDFLAVRRLLR